ncbi:MAG: DUF5672 family protein [Candidatus Falkowbacteria bacterium]|nr:DUF5672 family protein [Candidatus Falkowbacteria bacterium]
MKHQLPTVTLLGIDCVNLERLEKAISICQEGLEFGAVKILSSLPGANNIVKIPAINSTAEYSEFVINELHKYVDTTHVLLVQYDGFVLAPEAWKDEFLEYDYIGAPWLVADWSVEKFDFPPELVGQFVVGNGGFSLRSKKLLSLSAELAQAGEILRQDPEDVALGVWYRGLLENRGIKFAPVTIAKEFSFEGENLENYAWDGQFGFHGLKWTDISRWTMNHPEHVIDNPATIEYEREKWL